MIHVVQHEGSNRVGCSPLTYIIFTDQSRIILEQNLKNIHCTFRQATVHGVGGQLCDSESCFTIITEIQDREREKDCRQTEEVGCFFSLCCIYIFSWKGKK